MTASQHTIADRVLTMPVQIRKATQHNAMFAVDADAAQRLIDYSGLQVYRPFRGRAIATLIVAQFVDSDLGQYFEYSTCVMVKPPGADAAAVQSVFVAHMFVDQAFTLAAGRTIWGFPKAMADFTVRDGKRFSFDASIDGRFVIGMEFARGLAVPPTLAPGRQELRAYSCLDGTTRESPYEVSFHGVRYRPGGVRIRLGRHPYAK
ncbi:MAG TPA: acetoacetate decarboxylase family protein, partial [Mycobacterium sp.]|nr:acetoacetate decarboxylase family protein [Mycobacterium sp.]